MIDEQMGEFAQAVERLTALHTSQIAALRAVNDALIATICTALPPLTGTLQAHLQALAAIESGHLEASSRPAFDDQVQTVLEHLSILQGT